MRAPSRAVVVFAAIAAVTLSLSAQQTCPPPAEPVLHWTGLTSGCTAENEQPCEFGETIVFSVTPTGGGAYPACVTYEWDFGEGTTSTLASPSFVYTVNGTYFVLIRVSGGNVDVFGGKQLVIVPNTVVPAVERFAASATVVRRGQTVVLSWSTRNATRVQIDPLGLSFDATVTSYSFIPTVTRTYTLTAFGSAAFRVSSPVTVAVVKDGKRRSVRH